jgi:hypothetical protein
VSGVQNASLWSGTAASWVNLHAFLPAGFTTSEATGIAIDVFDILVTGSGFNSVTGRNEALLWTQTVPEPGTGSLLILGGAIWMLSRRRRPCY